VAAPAKLNLFLHIIGRRADGYHLLQSAFMLIDWSDTLHFELRPLGKLSREDLAHPLPADDLILRAARLLRQASGSDLGAHIQVEKRIPAQAGMGGGSSDAASTLLALNRLWNLRLSLSQLTDLGLQLGADVPFFLFGHNAWVEGIGERISPLEVPPCEVVVVKPPSGLSTQAIFSDSRLKRDTNTATISGFAADPFGFGRNDLQPVAQSLCPEMTQALEWLQSLGLRGRMTGSGSAVFAWAPPDFKLGKAPEGFEARLCHGLKVHPLASWAAEKDFIGR
jgi:4-diphosphocytidyl-2-C-methyl-D-erythritol kinase